MGTSGFSYRYWLKGWQWGGAVVGVGFPIPVPALCTLPRHPSITHHRWIKPKPHPHPPDRGEVYTWGWKECVPSGKVFGDAPIGGSLEKDLLEIQGPRFTEQVSPRSQGSKNASGSGFAVDSKGTGEDTAKRRRVSSAKQAAESSTGSEETLLALPCLVTLSPGVRISSVAAGGRHTLALSDVGQVWGWGYGGEGQLGIGSRIHMVSSSHPVPCIESSYRKDRHSGFFQGCLSTEGHGFRVPGTYIKGIACGRRHSAVITVWIREHR